MNNKFNKTNIVGWLVFLLVFIVYYFSVERNGSLWDCGEFVLGAYKLQVVHPPGAPFFIIIGRMPGLQTFYLTTHLTSLLQSI